MNTRAAIVKYLSMYICGGPCTTRLSFRESSYAAERKCCHSVEKPSIVVPVLLTTKKLRKEKAIRCQQMAINKKKSQPRLHIYYYFDLSWCNARYCARKRHSILDIFGVCYPPHQALNAKSKSAMWYRAVSS